MGWNGLDLMNDFSPELGDVSPSFKTKVLRWINEGIRDIATAHQWAFLREKRKVILADGESTNSLVETPAAPTVAALAGGSLALATSYKALITFYEAAADIESIAGVASSTIVPAGADLSIRLSNIPVSLNPLVTERRVYLQKASGAFQYHGTISNNLDENPVGTPVTYDISAEAASQVTPPDQHPIHMIDGDLFLETQGMIIQGTSVQDLVFKSNALQSSGIPSEWAPVNEEEVLVYPAPSGDFTASYYCFKRPARVFATVDSVPQMPDWLYEDLRRYVMWRGYDYRDRAGKESKQINYENGLRLSISRRGKPLKRSGRVRAVTPDSDGAVY